MFSSPSMPPIIQTCPHIFSPTPQPRLHVYLMALPADEAVAYSWDVWSTGCTQKEWTVSSHVVELWVKSATISWRRLPQGMTANGWNRIRNNSIWQKSPSSIQKWMGWIACMCSIRFHCETIMDSGHLHGQEGLKSSGQAIKNWQDTDKPSCVCLRDTQWKMYGPLESLPMPMVISVFIVSQNQWRKESRGIEKFPVQDRFWTSDLSFHFVYPKIYSYIYLFGVSKIFHKYDGSSQYGGKKKHPQEDGKPLWSGIRVYKIRQFPAEV